jgi:hypothetical protein
LLAAIPSIAAAFAAPRISRAFDAGEVGPITTAGGAIICSGGQDCPDGLICLNGFCSHLPVGGARRDAPQLIEQPRSTPTAGTTVGAGPATSEGQQPGTTEPQTGAATGNGQQPGTTGPQPSPRPNKTPTAEKTATPTASPTPEGGIGGEVGTAPLPAGIFKGRCGNLGADAEFPLIDVGSEQRPSSEAPDGAPENPTDFSATVVNASLDALLKTEHAIDIRIDPKDPKTSVACGNIEGQVDETGEKRELPVALDEQNASGVGGLAWIRDEGERALTYVYADRPRTEDGAPADEATYTKGDTVRPVADLNLRAEANTDAPIVGIIGAGTDLEVTADSADGWVPVREPISGDRGFVSEEYVEPAM